jgi:hypothetical protein
MIESESGTQTTPLVVLALHRINVNGALLADVAGTPVAWESDRVTLTGGVASEDDPRHPAFLANRVAVLGE